MVITPATVTPVPVRALSPQGRGREVAVGESLPIDRLAGSSLAAVTPTHGEVVAQPVPDVRGMLARNLRHSQLNLEINKVYVAMAGQFQDIYDADRKLSPSWYGFAPYASRQAGATIRRAETLTALLERGENIPSTGHHLEAELAFSDPDPSGLELNRFLLNLFGSDNPQLLGLSGPLYLTVAANRLRKLMASAEGPLSKKLATVARTVRDMLEDGNRRIVAEIGVAGQDYLEFRRSQGAPTPAQVLREFRVDGAPHNPAQAEQVFGLVRDSVLGGGPLVLDWETPFPEPFPRAQFLVAAFAAYEAARLESDPALKNRWVEQAGILLAFREQRDTVQAAFADSGKAGEVSRQATMEMSTPWISVPTRDRDWSFRNYAGRSLPPADANPFTPRASEYNWADFSTRWGGILDFFGGVFENPAGLWPMPSPHPSDPL